MGFNLDKDTQESVFSGNRIDNIGFHQLKIVAYELLQNKDKTKYLLIFI
jgi:hypothetical protein